MVTRIECFQPALNLINCYGEQRKSSKKEVELKWSRLKAEMEAIRNRGEFCLLAGDLNKLVGNDEWGVPGNHPEVSLGGEAPEGTASHQGLDPSQWPGGGGDAGGTIYQE